MDLEFDCPQFYDFENEIDDSHPEIYFETRQTRHTFSPYHSNTSFDNSVNSKGSLPSHTLSSPLSISDCGPSYNTRLSVKKKKDMGKKSARAFKRISSKFQPTKEPPVKKSKMTSSAEQHVFKKPLMTVKRERVRSSILKAKDRRRRAKYNLQRSVPLTRTVPEPFSFSTDKRIKTEPHDIPEYKHVDFLATLRSNKENQYHVRKGPVRAVPERLLRKRKVTDKKTMAEQVMSFQQGLSKREQPNSPPGEKRLRITQAISPRLRASQRSRPIHVMSQKEKEDLEAEEVKNYHFKAQPIDPRTFVPFVLKPRNQDEKPEPVSITLNTEKRAALRPRTRSVEPAPEFHARPVPKKILEGVTGLGEKVPAKTTDARSPPFLLKKREELWKQHEEAKQREAAEAAAAAEAKFKAPKRRDRTLSNSSRMQNSFKKEKRTVPAPFSFFERDQHMLAKKEEKIHSILEEEKKGRDFRANPMPSPSVSGLPARKKLSPTKVQAFSLDTDSLSQSKSQRWQRKLEEQMKLEKEATVFKAQPCVVTQTQPFMPAKSNKPTTEFVDFDLHSDSRAFERHLYDQKLKEKEEKNLALLEQQQREQEEKERKEIAQLRKKAVHKANPVPHVEPFKVKHGLIPVTEPITPKFKTDMRLKRKHE